jgi:hypothetical protein
MAYSRAYNLFMTSVRVSVQRPSYTYISYLVRLQFLYVPYRVIPILGTNLEPTTDYLYLTTAYLDPNKAASRL